MSNYLVNVFRRVSTALCLKHILVRAVPISFVAPVTISRYVTIRTIELLSTYTFIKKSRLFIAKKVKLKERKTTMGKFQVIVIFD